MFQIVRYAPTFCPITDATIGSSARRLPMTYGSPDLPLALAARLQRDDEEVGGDYTYRVLPTDADVWAHHSWPSTAWPTVAADECPF